MPNVPPVPAILRRLCREFPSVHPDGAPRLGQLKKLDDLVRLHNEFNSVVIDVQAWPTGRITIDLSSSAPTGCVLRVKVFPVLVLFADRLLVLLLSERGQRRRSAELTGVVKTPYSRKIMRIKGVTVDLVLGVRCSPIRVILTSGAGLPSRGNR